MPSNHLILCCPFLLLPSIFPSIRVLSNESALLMRWPKYWSFSFNISPTNEHPGLISFRMDWLDLLAVQGILKSLLQHHSCIKDLWASWCYMQVLWWTNFKTKMCFLNITTARWIIPSESWLFVWSRLLICWEWSFRKMYFLVRTLSFSSKCLGFSYHWFFFLK